ncbi:MAG TPA: hypothetical protein VMB49_10940 [Acidobacteriaceae bacterium]|nr:hypothetical protein [Acidobacteriaceae bacterium]
MRRLAGILLIAIPCALLAEEPAVRVEPANLQNSRPLQKQTETSVIRDYLESWRTLNAALEQNRPELLEKCFVGDALDKLTATVRQQNELGIRTRYQDRAHDLRVVFYSPEGMSIQLIDDAAYDDQVIAHGKLLGTQLVHRRYVVVMSPGEVRWRVRVLQAEPQ